MAAADTGASICNTAQPTWGQAMGMTTNATQTLTYILSYLRDLLQGKYLVPDADGFVKLNNFAAALRTKCYFSITTNLVKELNETSNDLQIKETRDDILIVDRLAQSHEGALRSPGSNKPNNLLATSSSSTTATPLGNQLDDHIMATLPPIPQLRPKLSPPHTQVWPTRAILHYVISNLRGRSKLSSFLVDLI